MTGKDGRYTLSLAPGDYTVKASLLGWIPASLHVVITAGQTATLDFRLVTGAIARDGL